MEVVAKGRNYIVMNPVVMFFYNRTPEQLELSKKALASVFAQDIPVRVYAVDNGSTEETWEWLTSIHEPGFSRERYMENVPPSRLANFWASYMFDVAKYPYFLSVPNDARLPRNCYSQLLRWPRGFVSASDNGHNEPSEIEATAVSENTPMAVMLTRRWAYQAIRSKDGYFFDEQFEHYCSDCDLALRMAACGIRGVQLSIPFWHYGSASWRLSTPEIGRQITDRADEDRARFVRKWGFGVSDPRYEESARDINFRGEPISAGADKNS